MNVNGIKKRWNEQKIVAMRQDDVRIYYFYIYTGKKLKCCFFGEIDFRVYMIQIVVYYEILLYSFVLMIYNFLNDFGFGQFKLFLKNIVYKEEGWNF